MILQEKFTLAAQVQEVWRLFMNFQEVCKCMPGLEMLEPIDGKHLRAEVKAKVSFITARFDLVFTVTAEQEPNFLQFDAKGRDRLSGSTLTLISQVRLTPISEGGTEVTYTADLSIGGKFATLGQRVISGKAKQVEEEFLSCIRAMLQTHIAKRAGA